eukprot:scaffold3.g6546.t1
MAKWIHHQQGEEEETSSEDESEQEDEEQEEGPVEASEAEEGQAEAGGPSTEAAAPAAGASASGRIRIKLAGGGEGVCHVCGQRGHTAGFRGAVYVDCPNKPCYLCGTTGHSTMTCPFRVAPGHGCTAAVGLGSETALSGLLKRERDGRRRSLPAEHQHYRRQRWQIDAAVLKLHSRRVTCIEFHPTHDHLVVTADKKGEIGVWDYAKVFERTVYRQGSINRWLTNALRFMPGSSDEVASASYDGTIFDVETGAHRTLYTANDWDWDELEGDNANKWVTMMGLDAVPALSILAAGDSKGWLHLLDPRACSPVCSLQARDEALLSRAAGARVRTPLSPTPGATAAAAAKQVHKKAGNDYHLRLLDIRNLAGGPAGGGAPSAADPKGKGKAAAGANTPAELGRKLLSTCQDNRLRVWDYLVGFGEKPPDRYLTPFRAEWDHKDPGERLLLCGRYISEEFAGDFGSVALHPIDLIDAATGQLVGQLTDPNLTTISPVNKPHPRCDLIISGSSRSLYAWRPAEDEEDEEGEGGREGGGGPDALGGSGGGGGGGGGGSGRLPFRLQASATSRGVPLGQLQRGLLAPTGGHSAHYVFFDADPDADKVKKKARTKVATPAAAHRQRQRSRSEDAEGGESGDDEAGPSSAGGKGPRGKGGSRKCSPS